MSALFYRDVCVHKKVAFSFPELCHLCMRVDSNCMESFDFTIVLSRTLEDTITMMITFVPYSVPAVFITGMLGVPVSEYVVYFFLPYFVQIIALFFAFTGIAIWKIDESKPIGKAS